MATHRPFPPAIWDCTPREVQDYILALEARVAALEATVQELLERVQQDSRNSSRPPSRDPPQRQRRQCQSSGRRPGGQPGHRGQTRTMVPVEEVDTVIARKPGQCARCQQPLTGDDPQPQRHHVLEIPPIRPVITEYHLHTLVCPVCGEVTRATLPEGVPTGTYGPRVHAITALLTGAYRLSKRTAQQVLTDLFRLPMSLGTISTLEAATAQAVAGPVEAARTHVQAQATAHRDETGWRQGGKRAWLWVAVTTWVTVFVVRLSRGGQVARELVGETFGGILVTDRFSAYTWYPVRWRQLCWAHLLRDIEAMIARGGRSREIGAALQGQARQMFHWWHRVRDGTLKRSSFRSYMSPVRREVERWLEAGTTCGVPKTEGVCRELMKVRQALWTFVHLEGVEPTNNAAERAIRPGVLWRKGSFGTHSAQGSRFVEALMTVVATLKQQQRNVLAYLTAACEAALRDAPAPSLLPPWSAGEPTEEHHTIFLSERLLELYDAVPKYFSNHKIMASMRKSGQYLPILKRTFEPKGETYMLYVRPARIMYSNGEEMEYYPSPREELVEEALRKIACDQVKGIYLDDGAGVQFTLYELKKELKERGHDIDKADLLEALKICNLTNISIQTADGKALMQSAIFPTLLIASREDWLAAPQKAKCYVQFNPLVTACINHITYRQFDYILYMEYKHRLSRWLYKRLAHNYIQAGLINLYTIKMSTILRDSGTHQSGRGANNLREVEKALQELHAKRILMRYETDIQRGKRNRVLDAKYTLHPDMDFINEVRKANSRALKLGDMWSQRRTMVV